MADVNDRRRFSGARAFVLTAVVAALVTLGVVALLISIFQRKQEARNPFYRVVELTDETDDPAVWGKNFPQQYDQYLRTVDGGSAARRFRRRPRRPIPAPSSRNRGSEERSAADRRTRGG